MCKIIIKQESIYSADTGVDLQTLKSAFVTSEHQCTEGSQNGCQNDMFKNVFENVMKWFDEKGIHMGNVDILKEEFNSQKTKIVKMRQSCSSGGKSLFERRVRKKMLLST